jgi:hypothetical protein
MHDLVAGRQKVAGCVLGVVGLDKRDPLRVGRSDPPEAEL